jgi:hypothetical protein
MAALSQEFMSSFERWTRKQLPLAPGVKAWKGGTCLGDPTNANVIPGAAATGKLFLGQFAETIDNTASTNTNALVNVDFLKEKTVLWRDNDGSITAANLFSACYVVDDHTVGASSSGKSKAGVILAVDSVLGVGFEVEGV